MAVLNVQDEFQSGDTVTATNLNNLVKDASFNADTTDNSTLEVHTSGYLKVKDAGVQTKHIGNDQVTYAKMQDVAALSVIGNNTNTSATPTAIAIDDLKDNISNATTSADGLMSSTDKTKLNGIEASANNYSHPTGDGNLHVPATGTTNDGNVLTAGSTEGSLSWTAIQTGVADGSVTTAKLANNAVTAAKISSTDADFSINSSGQVRIGTTNTPSSLLTVDGTIEILKDRQPGDPGTPEGGQIVLRAQDNTQERFVIDNYGVGDSIYRIYTTDDAGTQAGVDRFNIKASNGNVGISQSNPQYKLDVTGDINVTGDFRKNGNVIGGVSKYSSSWFNDTTGLNNGGTYTFTHNLGTKDISVTLWMATDASGSNQREVNLTLRWTGSVNSEGGGQILNVSTTQLTVQLAEQGWLYLDSNGDWQNGNWGTTHTHIKVVAIG